MVETLEDVDRLLAEALPRGGIIRHKARNIAAALVVYRHMPDAELWEAILASAQVLALMLEE